jgi:hypothetical protein
LAENKAKCGAALDRQDAGFLENFFWNVLIVPGPGIIQDGLVCQAFNNSHPPIALLRSPCRSKRHRRSDKT